MDRLGGTDGIRTVTAADHARAGVVRGRAGARAALILLVAGLSACGRGAGGGVGLLLAAASDLAPALPELTASFEAGTGIRVTATIGASGALAQQILNGAPVDVFASADRARIDQVARAGRVVAGTEAVYARGHLTVYTPPGGPRLASLEELSRPEIGRIAIANPESAPYGLAARTALERAGLWDALQPRIVIAETVRQTVQFVESGGAGVALTSLSLVHAAAGHRLPVPAELHQPLDQVLAVIARRPHEREARALADFLVRGGGRDILRRHGFTVPDSMTEAGR